MLTDTAALALAFVAMRAARRPENARHTFGQHRLQVLAALINGAALFAILRGGAKESINLRGAALHALGVLLGVAALLALGNAALQLWAAMRDWSAASAIFAVIERLLLVFMLIEILHTIRTSIQSRTLTCEPFLIVALIATVRRVLVITLQSAEVMRDAVWTPDHANIFRATMIDLPVMGMLILVMVISIYLLRRDPGKDRSAEAYHPGSRSLHTI